MSEPSEHAVSLVNLGVAYTSKGSLIEAVDCYNKAILLYPEYALAHYNLGCATEDLGDTEAAVDCYEKAIRLDSAYADPHFNLASIWHTDGNYMEALKHWLAYVKLDQSGTLADEARKHIEILKRKVIVLGGRAA